ARAAMERAGALHVRQLALQLGDALADQAPVDLELALAGAAEEAEAAALTLEMRPGAHQPRALIAECGKLHLELAFAGAGAGAENLEDEAGAVDDLALPLPFEIALLHRRHRRVDDRDGDLLLLHGAGIDLDRAAADQGRGAPASDLHHRLVDHLEPDRTRQPGRLIEPRLGRADAILARARREAQHRMKHQAAPGRDALSVPRHRHALGFVAFLAGFEELDRLRRHHGRDRMLVDELRVGVAAKQNAEVIEPSNDTLEFHTVHQKYCNRRLVLPNVIEEHVLNIL